MPYSYPAKYESKAGNRPEELYQTETCLFVFFLQNDGRATVFYSAQHGFTKTPSQYSFMKDTIISTRGVPLGWTRNTTNWN